MNVLQTWKIENNKLIDIIYRHASWPTLTRAINKKKKEIPRTLKPPKTVRISGPFTLKNQANKNLQMW